MDGLLAESSWGAEFPGIYKSSILRAAQAACVSEEWIRHIVNNWCASKHRRYMHTWSEYINSSHGWFILWRTTFNLLVTLDQLNINFVFLVISAVKLKLMAVQVGGGAHTETLQVMKMHMSQSSSVFISIALPSIALTHRRWIFHSMRATMKCWNKRKHVMFRNTNFTCKVCTDVEGAGLSCAEA